MRILTATEVVEAIPMARAIEVARRALEDLSDGGIVAPPRLTLELEAGALTLFMPGYRPARGDLAVKIVSVHPGNAEQGLPTVQALVAVFEATSGRPLGVLEGSALTALRTGAAVGVATDLLARADARTLAVFGAGVQARAAIRAICAVREIEEIRLISRTATSAERLARELHATTPRVGRVILARTPAEAVRGADVIVTATTSSEPVVSGSDLSPGSHVNAIGAFRPTARELDDAAVVGARIVVDTRAGCLAEAGDLLIPLAAGLIRPESIAELGNVLRGRQEGRTSREQRTLYKSVGHAALDVAIAAEAIRAAEAQGLGIVVEPGDARSAISPGETVPPPSPG